MSFQKNSKELLKIFRESGISPCDFFKFRFCLPQNKSFTMAEADAVVMFFYYAAAHRREKNHQIIDIPIEQQVERHGGYMTGMQTSVMQ